MKKVLLPLLLLFVIIVCVTNSCKKKDDETTDPVTVGTSGNTVTTSISGRIKDESNQPVAGATVSAYGTTATTDADGIFMMNNVSVNSSRCIVKVSKSGFFNGSNAFIPVANNVHFVNMTLMGRSSVGNFSSSTGGVIASGVGAVVLFPANAVSTSASLPYTGTVIVYIKPLPTDAPDFGSMIPGGDLVGKDTTNKDVILNSYGMLGVELTDNSGNPLQLSTGASATITFPIASAQLATAPSTIPLWYFDETTSLWKEQGQAVKSGNGYIGTVSHFTWWNVDMPASMATVKGRVVTASGVALGNLTISVNSIYTLTTDANGKFSAKCPSGTDIVFKVESTKNIFGLSSQQESVTPLSGDGAYTLPDLVCNEPASIKGHLKGCSNEAVSGYITVRNGGGFLTSSATANGDFSIAVPPGENLSVSINALSGLLVEAFGGPAIGGTHDLGDIYLCSTISPNLNGFWVEGDIYHNNFTKIDSNYSVAHTSTNFAIFLQVGSSFPELQFALPLSDTLPGNYTMNASTVQGGVLSMAPSADYNSHEPGSQFYLTLTKVDKLNGNVAGTFHGILYADQFYAANPVNVFGSFNIWRR